MTCHKHVPCNVGRCDLWYNWACDITCHTSAAIWWANDMFRQSTITWLWHQHFWCNAMKCAPNKKSHVASKFLAHFLTRDFKTIKRELSLARHDEWGKGDCRRWRSACHGARLFCEQTNFGVWEECQCGLISKIWYTSECLYKKPASWWHITKMLRATCDVRV
jgi:hypothetical protein